jgi:hypothetical protein
VGSKSRTGPRKFRQNLKNDHDGNGEIRKVSDSRLQDDVYQISGESSKPSSAGLLFNKKTKHEDNGGVSAREAFLPQAKAIA